MSLPEIGSRGAIRISPDGKRVIAVSRDTEVLEFRVNEEAVRRLISHTHDPRDYPSPDEALRGTNAFHRVAQALQEGRNVTIVPGYITKDMRSVDFALFFLSDKDLFKTPVLYATALNLLKVIHPQSAKGRASSNYSASEALKERKQVTLASS